LFSGGFFWLIEDGALWLLLFEAKCVEQPS